MEIVKVGFLEPDRKIQDSVIVYGLEGISPTIRARDYKGSIKVLENENKVDNDRQCKMLKIKVIELNKQPIHQQDLLMHIGGICRCIPAGTHGSTPHLLKILIKDNETQQIKVNSNGSDSNSTDGQYDRPHI